MNEIDGKEELLNYLCLSVTPPKAQVQQKRRYDYLEHNNHCISSNERAMKPAWNILYVRI